MPIYDASGSLKVTGDRASQIAVYDPTGSLVTSTAQFLQFTGSAVVSVTTVTSGVLVNLQGSSGSASSGSSGSGSFVTPTPLTILGESNVSLWLKSDRGVVQGTVPAVTGWADQTANKNDAIQTNSSLQPSYFTGSINFDGSADYMTVADSITLDSSSYFAVGMRIRPDSLASGRAWLAKSNNGGGAWSIQYSGELRFWIGAPGINGVAINAAAFTAGAWHTILFVFDGTASGNANRLRAWVNGAQQSGSYYGTVPATITNESTTLTIGAYGDPTQYFQGAINEIVISKGQASAQQIVDINNYLTNPSVSGSIAFTKGIMYNYPILPRNTIVWRSDGNHVLANVRGLISGSTGATASFQAARNSTSLHLSATMNLTSNNTWFSGGVVASSSYSEGDFLQVRLLGISGTIEHAIVQFDFSS